MKVRELLVRSANCGGGGGGNGNNGGNIREGSDDVVAEVGGGEAEHCGRFRRGRRVVVWWERCRGVWGVEAVRGNKFDMWTF